MPPELVTLTDQASSLWAGSLVQTHYNVDTPWHCHDVHQLHYAFDGAMEVEDDRQRALLPRQLAAWVPAGVIHRTSLHHVHSMSVMFSRQLIPQGDVDGIRIIAVPPLLRELILEAGRWPIDAILDLKGVTFFKAFAMLLAEWIEHEAPLTLPTSADAQLSAAMRYTRENLSTASIHGASLSCNMSVRTLRRRFQSAGIAWEEYRRRARLLAAVELLDRTSKSIGEVSFEVGYENQSSFTKIFSHYFKISPKRFRDRA